MARYRRKRSRGGGGGAMGVMQGPYGASMLVIMGAISMVISLIIFGISIQQLDTGITSALTYGWATGLPQTMGIFGMVFFLLFVGIGLGGLGGGALLNVKRAIRGGGSEIFISIVMGGVTLMIALIVFNMTLTQLNTAIGVVNSTTNYATYFTNTVSIMGVFGLVIFVTFVGAAIAQMVAGVFGIYKQAR